MTRQYLCECRWDAKSNKRVYCTNHQIKRERKEPKRPILYASPAETIYQTGLGIPDQVARALFFFTYLTGGRINEITDFSLNRLTFKDDYIYLRIKTLKQRKKSQNMRELPIPIGADSRCHESKMWEDIKAYVAGMDNFAHPFKKWGNMSMYLARALNIQAEAKVRNPATGEWSDKIITKKCNPHYLRHCRAAHLVQYYDFNTVQLCKFFGWTDPKMALRYTDIKDLGDAFKKSLRNPA